MIAGERPKQSVALLKHFADRAPMSGQSRDVMSRIPSTRTSSSMQSVKDLGAFVPRCVVRHVK